MECRAEHDTEATSVSTARPDAPVAASKSVVELGSKLFAMPESYVERLFKARPNALAGAMQKEGTNEKDVAWVVGELYGRINEAQLKALIPVSIEALSAINAKEESQRTAPEKEMGAFLWRVLWAAKALRDGKPGFENLAKVERKDPKTTDFQKEFLEHFKKVQEKNKEFTELMAKAAKSGPEAETAKDRLRAEFDFVPAFLESQLASGNEELTNNLIAALAFQNGKDHFLDVVDNETPFPISGRPARARIELGSDPKNFSKNLRATLARSEPLKNGGFGRRFGLTHRNHGTLDGVQVFKPADEVTPAAVGTVGGAGVAGAVGSGSGNATGNGNVPRVENANTTVDAGTKLANLLVAKRCTSCHGAGGDMPLVDAAGKLSFSTVSAARLAEVLRGENLGSTMSRRIPILRSGLTAEEKQSISDWARGRGLPMNL